MNENQREHHARLGEHNGGDYDMRYQTRAPVMDPARVREVQAAALARKDALLRMAMEALQGCVPVTFSDATVSRRAAAIASIEAELSQSPAPVAVQPSQWQDIAGWKLVPIEPTEAMVEYGKDERMRCFDTTGRESNPVSVGEALTRIYGAMLSASPEDKK